MSRDGKPKARNGVDTLTLPRLPQGWAWAFIDELGEVVTGSTPSKERSEYYGGQIPLFKPTDLNAGYNVREYADSLTEIGSQQARLLPPNTVLVTCIGATIGKTGLARVKCATNQQINAVVLPREMILPEWGYSYFISNFAQRQIRDNASATTLPIINKTKFGGLPFPVAPTHEQHRIVAKLEELFSDLDAGVAALERAKANLKRYRAAVLKAAVEGKLTEDWRAQNPPKEPAAKLLERILKERRKKWEEDQLAAYDANGKQPPKNWRDKYQEPSAPDTTSLPALPEGWCWVSVEQLGDVQLGRQRSPKNQSKDYPTQYIRAANLTERGLDVSDVLDMEFKPNEVETYRLAKGDIVVSEASGSPDQVGKPAVWNDELPLCCFQNTVIRLRPHHLARSAFLLTVFRQCYFNKIFAKVAAGVGINHLSAAKFARLMIPLAPEDEQAEVAAEVERRLSILAQSDALITANLRRSSRLRQSILKRAFEGKLVPQDPTDEPASVLLERIKTAATGSDTIKNSRKSPRTIRRRAAATKETESLRNEVS